MLFETLIRPEMSRLLFFDAASIFTDVNVIRQNGMIWGDKSLDKHLETKDMSVKNVCVLAALSSIWVIGPNFLSCTATAVNYEEMLQQYGISKFGMQSFEWYIKPRYPLG